MNKFGWSYPPGCSGPPEEPDPNPISDEIYELLENAGVDQTTIDKVTAIVDRQISDLSRTECPHCMARLAESERASQEQFEREHE